MLPGRRAEAAPGDAADHVVQVDRRRGRAVQVETMKPMLNAPGTKRLKLSYDEPLSNFAFEIQLAPLHGGPQRRRRQGLTLVHFSAQLESCLTRKNTLHTLNTP